MKKGFIRSMLLSVIFALLCSNAFAAEQTVIPIGHTVGIQLYTDGILVIGMSPVNGVDAAKDSGIQVNDRIISVNGKDAPQSEEFSKIINENPNGVRLEVMRDEKEMTLDAVPALADDGVYRLGLWVRDSCAGVGTVTYYSPESNSFAALGHAVNDVDTGDILRIKSGNILECSIMSVTKGRSGCPGEINASFTGDKTGDILVNSPVGIFGTADAEFNGVAMPVAAKEQITEGDAYIISDISGKTEKYSVCIRRVTNDSEKGLVVEVTDSALTDLSGGIVQGMSGSPIIQNGRLIGALTHVFVNNPLKGYGTLAEKMIDAERNML